MTRSRFDVKGEKRPHSVVPVRAAKLCKLQEMRVLVGLGHFANRAGVCWPSMSTLYETTGVDTGNVSRCIERLIELGLVRKLQPNDYDQKPGQWGMSNRYQLMWAGDDPLPTYEEVQDAATVRFAAETVPAEGSGARGLNEGEKAAASRVAAAVAAAVERRTGVRPAGHDEAIALRLIALQPADLERAVADVVRARGRAPLWPELEAWAVANRLVRAAS